MSCINPDLKNEDLLKTQIDKKISAKRVAGVLAKATHTTSESLPPKQSSQKKLVSGIP